MELINAQTFDERVEILRETIAAAMTDALKNSGLPGDSHTKKAAFLCVTMLAARMAESLDMNCCEFKEYAHQRFGDLYEEETEDGHSDS